MAGKKPRVSVIERRLQNPFGEPSAPVRLKDTAKVARWFNSSIRPDQFWRAKELGWQGVTPEMVIDITQIGFHTVSPEGYIARGERSQEILMCMDRDDYHAIQTAKTRENLERMRDFDREKHAALNAYASKAGGNAAEFMEDKIRPVGGVRTQVERVQRVAEEGDV